MDNQFQDQGVSDAVTPRAVLKKAFEVGLVTNGRLWLKGLEDRNLTSNTYNEVVAERVVELVRESYYPLFQELIGTLGSLKK